MPQNKTRFVTACQQLLTLAVIVAVLTPAANVMSLDLVPDAPDSPTGTSGLAAPDATLSAYAKANAVASVVPTAPVDAAVTEVPLTAPKGARIAPGALKARATARPGGAAQVLSTPQPVTGYGAVGVTWQHGLEVEDDAISVEVRTQDDDAWSQWMPVEYHDDHGPDAGSEEARAARPGTDALLVGDVDNVQVRVQSEDAAPADMKLAVIDPGQETTTARQTAAIDTATLEAADPLADAGAATPAPAGEGDAAATGEDGLALQKAVFTPKPVIYSRAQWGADESLRDKGSLRYFEVHAGFVHHTVNANSYTRAQVPGILRSIYAYHTRSRGWSDVGYNYLVDRFGRIWEGRAGGIDRPVVGAHTLGYNDDSFSMSAIGNFEEARPTTAMVEAYGVLFGWKLSLHGVTASSPRQYVTSRNFAAINGHRDAGSTACPGKYLYAQIPKIRQLAAAAQKGFAGRQLESNIAATAQPDLVVRRASDGQGFVIPLRKTANGYAAGKALPMYVDLSNTNRILNAGDWDRDGYADLITRHSTNGKLYLRRGLGNGQYARYQELASGFGSVGLLAAVGDMTGDGFPDLMGQPRGGDMRIYPGAGVKGLHASYVARSAITGTQHVPMGLYDADGAPDSFIRHGSKVTLYSGNGPGGFSSSKTVNLNPSRYDWLVGISDIGLTGRPDLVGRDRTTGQLFLLESTSANGFGAPRLLGSGFGAYDLVD